MLVASNTSPISNLAVIGQLISSMYSSARFEYRSRSKTKLDRLSDPTEALVRLLEAALDRGEADVLRSRARFFVSSLVEHRVLELARE